MLLVVTFDQPVTGAGGLDVSDVTMSSGTVSAVAVNGNELSVSISGITSAGTVTVDFPGIVSVGNGAAVNQSLCFGVLHGDASLDGVVNSLDYIAVRGQIGPLVTDSNCRCDVNADGAINSLDYISIRGKIGN